MALLESKLIASRAVRDSAKLELDERLAQVKLDLAERGIAGRIADEVADRAKMVFDEAADVVHEHPNVVGGTIAASVLWVLRNPIIGWLERLLGSRR